MSESTSGFGPVEQSAEEPLGERICDWYAETTRRVASTVVQLDDKAWGLVTPEWPLSYQHNGILVRRDPGSDALRHWGDEVLGGGGLSHRYVMGLCDLTSATHDALLAAGYTVQVELLMARDLPGEPYPGPEGVVIERVGEAVISPLQRRLWTEEWLPSADEETVRQLTGRRETYSRIGDVTIYTVRGDGDEAGQPVTTLDLRVRDWCAEIDGVATLAPYRGRGYGDAMLAAAVGEATRVGCSHAILTALSDDWPKLWYARRGFRQVATSWVADLAPHVVGPVSAS